ncbi:MAG: hypothetical protein COT74_02230 [Bdellovibrionales bacterium CG10_big_fil_rev_8_21_14_0_10_45_34]|nr:MAG: hypothetical protein COT74_02230 [Bdellovibrionales bacterium CG10_big_fil_rev_8_21_14_0_10_45_34]
MTQLNKHFKALPQTLYRAWPFWLLILPALEGINSWLRESTQPLSGLTRLLAQLPLMISYLFLSVLTLTIYVWAHYHKGPLKDHFKKYIAQTFIETARALLRIVIGLLLFVLPGLYLITRYAFIGFVVQLDKNYDDGQVDALASSAKLMGHWALFLTPVMAAWSFGEFWLTDQASRVLGIPNIIGWSLASYVVVLSQIVLVMLLASFYDYRRSR